MSDLTRIKKTKLYHDAIIGAQRLSYKLIGPEKYTPGWLFRTKFDIRAKQVMLTAGQIDLGAIGDSRLEEFEAKINEEPRWLCLAQSGSKENPDWINEWDKVLLPLKVPLFRAVMHEEAGNDFLNGADVQTVLKNRLAVREKMTPYFLVLEHELCPLSPDAAKLPVIGKRYEEINHNILQFNALLQPLVPTSHWVAVNDELAPKGVGLQKFFVPDGVHWGAEAWPILKARWKEALKVNGI